MEKNIEKEILKAPKQIENIITKQRKAVFTRFPLLFTLLGTFGLVATFYGFERLMDQLGLSDNPIILLLVGIGILIFTGTLYKRLQS